MVSLKRFIYFCIVGGTGAFIELITFNILYLFCNFPISKLFALLIALTFNFTINRNFTFSASLGKKMKQIPRYVLVYSIGILVNYGSSILINNLIGKNVILANISVAAGIILAIPITFLGSAYWVFKE